MGQERGGNFLSPLGALWEIRALSMPSWGLRRGGGLQGKERPPAPQEVQSSTFRLMHKSLLALWVASCVCCARLSHQKNLFGGDELGFAVGTPVFL